MKTKIFLLAFAMCISIAGISQDTTGTHKNMRKGKSMHSGIDSSRHSGMNNSSTKKTVKPRRTSTTGMDSTNR